MRRRPSALAWLDLAAIASVILVTVWSMHPSLIFSTSLITGGDTGSHVQLPAFLRSQNDIFHLTPWFPGWFDGMPAYSYYFVLPDYLSVLASYLIPFTVAFKLATIAGSVLMPVAAYIMGRLIGAPRPVPVALAMGTLPFLFDASFTIDGGNLFSTMAGEYAFSFSLALAMITIGLFARGLRTGRGYWLAAISLSLTLAAHLLPWMYSLGVVGIMVVLELLARRGFGDPRAGRAVGDFARPVRFAVGAGLISLGLSAWWLLAFATTQSLTTSMGYTNDPTSTPHQIFSILGWYTSSGGPAGDRWVITMAAVAALLAAIVRDRVGLILTLSTLGALVAFIVDPQSAIWNERLIPFWYLGIHLLAAWMVGYLAWRWVERRRRLDLVLEFREVEDDEEGAGTWRREWHERLHRGRVANATSAVALLGLLSTVPALVPGVASALHFNTTGNEVTNWAAFNYEGYQGQPSWPEYHDLMTTMARVGRTDGCGRAMWEYNSSENRFGTPMALMLLPYWTNNCVDSMEGLFFESSPTTPYHFLDQAELSLSPSDPEVGLDYGPPDVAFGVEHLQMLGVRYYIAFSPSIVAQANRDPYLHQVAVTHAWPSPGVTWHVYEISDSPMVVGLRHEPVVVAHISSRVAWLTANESWYLDQALWKVPYAESGPASWPRAATPADVKDSPALPSVRVSDIRETTQSISFHVSRVGVPVVVKISYYPRWHAQGATGPYRVSPDLMVVVPTSHEVSLVYGASPAVRVGSAVTIATVLGGLVVVVLARRRRRRAPL